MSTQAIDQLLEKRYEAGFVTDIETEFAPPGLNEDIIRFISAKKGEPSWLLDWRLGAYRHWLRMKEPRWAKVSYGPIDYQASSNYAAPKTLSLNHISEPPRPRVMSVWGVCL